MMMFPTAALMFALKADGFKKDEDVLNKLSYYKQSCRIPTAPFICDKCHDSGMGLN